MNNISYSMFIDNNIEQNINYITDRKIHLWVKNDLVINCYKCNIEFGFFVRKHHCRSCGRIFCHECAQHYIKLPRDMEDYPLEPEYWSKRVEGFVLCKDNELERVCINCYNRINQLTQVKQLIKVFELLNLDICTLYNIKLVSSSWNKSANYCLNQFRVLQYKLPFYKLLPKESLMLWNNRHIIIGHSRLTMQLIKSIDKNKINELIKLLKTETKKYNCWNLMCSRYCTNNLSVEDAIELIRCNISGTYFKQYICAPISKLTNDEFICYIPYLINYLYSEPYLVDIIFQKCSASIEIRTEVMWAIHVQIDSDNNNKIYYESIREQLVNYLNNNISNADIIKLNETFTTINKLKNKIKNMPGLNNNIYVPINPHISYSGIDINDIIIMDSACKPTIIPFYYYENNTKKINKIMFKSEDVRKDQIITKIIKLMKIILLTEENLDLDIINYNVIPTSKCEGIIEIVDKAETVYNILEKQKMTIQNFIMEHNKDKRVTEIRDKFIKSTASYCVISHLLGIGDRHLDNIMISESGSLFHIDFGYILGNDPKYSSSSIRITPDILDAMGGANSVGYIEFQRLCTQIFNCLRRHVNLFTNLLLMLVDNNGVSIEKLEHEIIKRFEPGESTIEAKMHLVNKMNNSTGTIEYKIIDITHKTFKENTIINVLKKFNWT